jgi:methionine sulfoxide reductase catalytic subunit
MARPSHTEITPEHLVLSRRRFLTGAIASAAGGLLAACAPGVSAPATESGDRTPEPETGVPTDALTAEQDINSYNNYYEFSLSKTEVQRLAQGFDTSDWTLTVDGLVERPTIYTMADIEEQFRVEERVERMRCVEAWSMVIPWLGFPLHRLLDQVRPREAARYVRFEALRDPERMPGQRSSMFDWPYVEGLRIDEALHDLTILATGLYDKPLTPQMGEPVRLVVPWKYGFKSIKGLVRITLVDEMPTTFWMDHGPREYGFYANVNPNVDHPRWSQASERRIGERARRPTLMFNGYEEEVASLYEGMDLRAYF